MGLADVVQIEDAPARLKALVQQGEQQPRMIGVYGFPDEGKTHFCKTVREAYGNENDPWKVMFVDGIEQVGRYPCTEYYLVQIPAQITTKEVNNELLKRAIGRPFDLHVVVVNPNVREKTTAPERYKTFLAYLQSRCDLVVENPKAEPKATRNIWTA